MKDPKKTKIKSYTMQNRVIAAITKLRKQKGEDRTASQIVNDAVIKELGLDDAQE